MPHSQILLDYGTIEKNISNSLITKARPKNTTTTNWYIRGGAFQTQSKATVLSQLQDLDHTKTITYSIHIYDTKNS